MAFRLQVAQTQLDVRLSVMCGQVFRWRDLGDGAVGGVDGAQEWTIVQHDGSLDVSGGSPEDFQRLFRIGEDWVLAERQVRRADPKLAAHMDLLPGLRWMRPSDPVEVFFSFLCSSNNHLPRIKSMVEKLAAYGRELYAQSGAPAGHAFPSVEAIASIPEAELRSRGFGYRAATIPSAARDVVERGGSSWFLELERLPYSEARDAMLEIKGVGPKLADCICLFGLNHGEAVPVDTHVWQAATRLYFPDWAGTNLTASKYRAVGDLFREKFGRLAGWAHQFLFYANLLNWRTRRP
ncbi:MAG: hypothetical protein JSS66_15050 [Armatimonadetes bacterium]|nr:hypothetical protein [Armatimonadota bacterium]